MFEIRFCVRVRVLWITRDLPCWKISVSAWTQISGQGARSASADFQAVSGTHYWFLGPREVS